MASSHVAGSTSTCGDDACCAIISRSEQRNWWTPDASEPQTSTRPTPAANALSLTLRRQRVIVEVDQCLT
eukprot:1976182-Amphidinium_carterae.1